MRSWQLQDAKARLSEVIKSAMQEGPQQVTTRNSKDFDDAALEVINPWTL
ncbi:MAG: type II toxin-antitoxin system prevent-host-death family antitoxin [Mariprofundus sp.]|nr:type II toxin-antitoxin system prevent-host-death family antitoxin [Mariprofundus sp.]